MSGTDTDHDAIIVAFLKRFVADQASGRVRTADEYAALFPGFEAVVAREFARFAADDDARDDDAPLPDAIGRYRILRRLGAGAQGDVYLAEDTALERRVALKVLHAWVGAPRATVQRFRREATLASRLHHPSICTVFETGDHDGAPFIAMQFIEGETLGAAIGSVEPETGAPTRPEVATIARFAKIVEQCARAVDVAHRENVLHRDLKPQNILIGPDDLPVVLDFGLARPLDEGPSDLSEVGALFGTPAYMAPEQVMGSRIPLDARVDVYALGVTLYECATGQRPFRGPTRDRLYQSILAKPVPAPTAVNRKIPRDLGVIIETAMARDRDHRYQTAADLADDLEHWRCGRPIRARAATPPERLYRWAKREPVRAALIVACVLIAVGLGYALAALPGIRANRQTAETVRRDERFDTALTRGYTALLLRDHAEAERAFRAARTTRRASREATAGLALALTRRGDTDRARDVLDRFVRDGGPPLPQVRIELLRVCGATAAAARLERAQQDPTDPLDCFLSGLRLARRYSRERTPALAAESLRHAERAIHLARTPHVIFACGLAEVAGRTRDVRAARHAAAALSRDRTDDLRVALLAALATEVFDREAAIRHYRRVVAREPHVVALNNLASALSAQGEHAEALALVKRARALAPAREALAKSHVAIAFDAGDLPEQIDAYRALCALRPGDSKCRQKLAGLLHRTKRFEDAVTVCREATALAPKNAKHWANLSIALFGLGQVKEATTAIERARALAPLDDQMLRHHAYVSFRAGATERAATLYGELADRLPRDWRARHGQGLALRAAGRHRDAVRAFGAAHRVEDNYETCYSLGGELLTTDRPAHAEAMFRRALEHRHTSNAHYNLGAALVRSERFRDANDAFARATALRTTPWPPAHRRAIDDVTDRVQLMDLAERYEDESIEGLGFERLMAILQRGRPSARAALALWRDLFARFEDRTTAQDPMAHARAAVAAMRAIDAPDGDDGPALRRTALRHARAFVARTCRARTDDRIDPATLRERLDVLRRARSLESVRTPAALATLPEIERAAWRALWRRVEDAIRRTRLTSESGRE